MRIYPLLLLAVALGCAPPPVDAPGDREAYLHDREARRAALEAALWRPDLPYSQSLLTSYALPVGGWDLLPVFASPVAPFRVADGDALAAGGALDLADGQALVPATLPTDETGWRALGAEVFNRLPMRADRYLDWLAARPERWAEVGIVPRADGTVRGLVRFADADGAVRVGMTCAFCHGADETPGRGDRRLNLGLARALFAEARGQAPTDAIPAALRAWGEGQVDVTDGALDNPTRIPDLVGLAQARFINHSGVIRVAGRTTFAVRFETQYILGHRMARRPDRALTWALATYVTGLEAPTPTDPPAAGAALFARRCGGCHDAAQGYGGGLVPASALASDPAVAFDPERGTGAYRVPRLLGIAGRAPYLHDGSAPTLEALLADGHPAGLPLDAADQATLIEFLNTL
ncbi:MAG: hypothetical protein R3F60_27340 [bacterium]